MDPRTPTRSVDLNLMCQEVLTNNQRVLAISQIDKDELDKCIYF